MSHRIYTTPGFVLGSRPNGEGGKILFIFTEELGLVSAIAQGIRLSKSKLRYHAQDYSFANFSLVRGKDFWRVVGAEAISGAVAPAEEMEDSGNVKKQERLVTISKSDPAYALRVRMFSILSRLLQGEEKNAELFAAVNAAHEFLTTRSPEVVELKKTIEYAEPIIMLRILHYLGYVRQTPDFASFLGDNSFKHDMLAMVATPGMKVKIIKEINTALQESHL